MSADPPAETNSQTRMERRLAAILSADVQGYSRLMEDDDEHTVRTLTAHRTVMTELIDEHRGRVVDSPGDNMLAEFASVIDAVHSAVAIQAALRERNADLPQHRHMVFRIGINLGDVIVDGERLYGDGVNLAARLESLADGGGVSISGTVYDQVAGKLPFAFTDQGEYEVKNIARPVRVYKVELPEVEVESPGVDAQPPARSVIADSQRSVPAAASPPTDVSPASPDKTQIVGREAEFGYLNQCLDTVLRGQRQIVFITGEPGIGKTTLVDAWLEQLKNQQNQHGDQANILVARGQCVEQYGTGEAYLPLLEASSGLCRGPYGAQAIQALKQYAPSWLRQLPGLVSEEEFADILQQVQGVTHERMLREMAEVAEVMTAAHPCVVVLEDLHWSDASTLEWLAYIARRREPAQLLVLATYRPGDIVVNDHPLKGVAQELHGRGQCEELRLEPLSEAAIAAYVRRQLPDVNLTPGLSHDLHQRTGGNALFMVAMVEALAQQSGSSQAMADIEEGIPDNLRQLIEKQIDTLSEEERRLLEAASVVGRDFSVAAVVAGLQDSLDLAEERCERLARSGQILQAQGTEEWPDGTLSGRYSFRNSIYHDVLYDRIATVRKARWHKRIGEAKAQAYGQQTPDIAAELALHFEAGRDAAQAVRYRQQASAQALQRCAHGEAAQHARKGLALLDSLADEPQRVQHEIALQTTLGVSLFSTQGFGVPEVAQTFSRARVLCEQVPGSPELFPVLYGLWNFYFARAEFAGGEVDRLAAQMQTLAQETPDTSLQLGVASTSAQSLFHKAQFQAAAEAATQGINTYNRVTHTGLAALYGEDPGVLCHAYAGLAAWVLGYPDRACEHVQRSVQLAQELNQPMSVAQALLQSVIVYQFRQEPDPVAEQTQQLLQLGEEQGFPLWTAGGLILSGWVQAQQGQATAGIEAIRQGLEIWHATGTELARPYCLSLLAEAFQQAGDIEQGLETATEALAAIDETQELVNAAELHRLKGELLLHQMNEEDGQDAQEAEACFQQALAIAREQQARSFELRTAVSLGRLWQSQGKLAVALELVAEVYAWFSEGFETPDLRAAQTLLTELEQAEPQEPMDHPVPRTSAPSTHTTHSASVDKLPTPTPGEELLIAPGIVGREDELSQLSHALDRALAGERQIVFVAGEPGIGKTTLVDAFLSQASAQSARGRVLVGHGQCVEQYGAGEAYLPLLEAIGRLGRETAADDIRTVLRRYAPTWLVQLPALVHEDERAALRQQAQGATQARMLREMAEALEAVTTDQPLVLVLEDLHWSDTPTLELLTAIAQRREAAKLLILGTYRPADVLASEHPLRGVMQELQAHGQCEEIIVSRLQEAAVGLYLTQRFGDSLSSQELLETIHRRTDGNPLFMVNMVDYLTQQHVMFEEAGAWTIRETDFETVERGVPDNLRQLIERQVESVDEHEQQLLEVASVVGSEFSAAAIAAGLQVEVEAIEERCEQVARTGQFIQAQGTEEWPDGTLGERYIFQHALYQSVLYERLTETRRARYAPPYW